MEAELLTLRENSPQKQSALSLSKRSPGQQLASPAPSAGVNCETCIVGKDCTCINDVGAMNVSTLQSGNETRTDDNDESCGLCSSTSGSCLCEELGIRNRSDKTMATSTTQIAKRKRSGSLVPVNTPLFPMEIDFTAAFSGARRDELPNGGCGFCADSSTCICVANTLPPIKSDIPASTTATAEVESRMVSTELLRGTPMSIDVTCTGEPGNPHFPARN